MAQVSALQTKQPAGQSDHPLTFRSLDQPVEHSFAPPLPPSFPLPFDAANLHSHDKFYKELEDICVGTREKIHSMSVFF
jgi:hypothetical protein